jgi:hypothetical protein
MMKNDAFGRPIPGGWSNGEWAMIIVASALAIGLMILYYNASLVANKYRFVRREERKTPTPEDAAQLDATLKGSRMLIEMGLYSTTLTLTKENESVFKKFTADIPLFFHADATQIDPVSNAHKPSSDGSTWEYSYIRYLGGYPNIILTLNDKDKQFVSKWYYTVDAPIVPMFIDLNS